MTAARESFADGDVRPTRPIGLTAGARSARLRVLLMVTELEDYTIAFANGVAAHADVTLAVPARQYAPLARWLDPRVDLRLLDWPRHSSLANLTFVPRIARLVRRERPDVVHLLSNNVLWLNLAAPLWRPIPLITTIHDVQTHPGDRETGVLPAWSTQLIVRQSDHVVVHGASLRTLAAHRFGKLPQAVHVLAHPAIRRYADLARAKDLRRRTDKFTLLLFGRVYAYKGLEQLVRAEALLGERIPGLRIVVAGRGDDAMTLRPLMGDPGRYDIVNQFIEDDEVAQMFLDADAVVLPYVEASQSGVLNVAAAFGKPVIVTDVGELRATVEPAGIGLVVPPANPAALADAMARLADSPDLRAQLGQNALCWAEGANAPEAVGARAAALYARVARR